MFQCLFWLSSSFSPDVHHNERHNLYVTLRRWRCHRLIGKKEKHNCIRRGTYCSSFMSIFEIKHQQDNVQRCQCMRWVFLFLTYSSKVISKTSENPIYFYLSYSHNSTSKTILIIMIIFSPHIREQDNTWFYWATMCQTIEPYADKRKTIDNLIRLDRFARFRSFFIFHHLSAPSAIGSN